MLLKNNQQRCTFIFDFDSTLFPGESLDEIIYSQIDEDEFAKKKFEQITAICNLGMTGAISMAESLQRRLQIATPTHQSITQYVSNNQHRIDLDLRKVLQQLQANGHQIIVVSGGFEEWIIPLLNGIIPSENVHANRLKDATRPMQFDNIIIRPKEIIIKELTQKNTLTGTTKIMIGDGATDFSVFEKGLADQFIGSFFYTAQGSRTAIIQKAAAAQQAIFTDIYLFIEYLRHIYLSS